MRLSEAFINKVGIFTVFPEGTTVSTIVEGKQLETEGEKVLNEKLEKMREMLNRNPGLKVLNCRGNKPSENSGEAIGEEAMLLAARSVFGPELTLEDLKATKTETQELSPDEMEGVAGGMAVTAGGYIFNYRLHHPTACPDCLAEGEYTGQDRDEEWLFGLFCRHQGQFRCNKCNTTWWVYGK